eukprot:gene8041-8904_t
MENSFRFNFGEVSGVNQEVEEKLVVEKKDQDLTDSKEAFSDASTRSRPIVTNSSSEVNHFKEHVFTVSDIDELMCKIDIGSLSTYYPGKNPSEVAEGDKVLYFRSNLSLNASLLDEQKQDIANVPEKLREVVKNSDLNSGIYEGGFKVWECSLDLVEFLHDNENQVNLLNKDVLELGCGAGLPGIYCLLSGANTVCFQDFNAEVIDLFTIPNVAYNNTFKQITHNVSDICDSASPIKDNFNIKCKFLSGHWETCDSHFKKAGKKFDVILSSETIYNPNCYAILHSLICNCLKRDGVAFFANKSYYFGVGGGTTDFMNYVADQSCLTADIVMQIKEGVKRDVVRLKWKAKSIKN